MNVASGAARAPAAAKVSRRASSPCQVATSESPWTVEPCSRSRVMERGTSCMVERTRPSCIRAAGSARLSGGEASVRPGAGQDHADRPGQDDQVEGRRPALDVVEVELHALLPAGLLAPG